MAIFDTRMRNMPSQLFTTQQINQSTQNPLAAVGGVLKQWEDERVAREQRDFDNQLRQQAAEREAARLGIAQEQLGLQKAAGQRAQQELDFRLRAPQRERDLLAQERAREEEILAKAAGFEQQARQPILTTKDVTRDVAGTVSPETTARIGGTTGQYLEEKDFARELFKSRFGQYPEETQPTLASGVATQVERLGLSTPVTQQAADMDQALQDYNAVYGDRAELELMQGLQAQADQDIVRGTGTVTEQVTSEVLPDIKQQISGVNELLKDATGTDARALQQVKTRLLEQRANAQELARDELKAARTLNQKLTVLQVEESLKKDVDELPKKDQEVIKQALKNIEGSGTWIGGFFKDDLKEAVAKIDPSVAKKL